MRVGISSVKDGLAFRQGAKFVAVGAMNTIVDLAVLNTGIFLTGAVRGWPFAILKTISFFSASYHSFFWNKHWTFRSSHSGNLKKFYAVTIVGWLVNVGVSTAVTIYDPIFPVPFHLWANVAALCGVALGAGFNFLGYKYLVFLDPVCFSGQNVK